ncbi:MAG TPA: NAD(P)H-dependent oxidoreductase [Streptosporangiaceae bacterium]|jgi:FMN reductase|nr:NAD(P)H-dependent oxidoreductase [Streptosporangiaceae bacterium]
MASPLAFPKASHASTVIGSRRTLVVGIGGSRRPGSSTERVIAAVLEDLESRGAATQLYGGESLLFPHYEPGAPLTAAAADYLATVRAADAIVLGSPGYHGGISGLVKNAVDYLEELRDDPAPYLDGKAVGCVSTAYGWQAAVSTLSALRQTVHALRGWPTPYGIAMNVADGLCSFDGRFTDTRAGESARIVAGQIMQFVTAFRDTSAPSAPELRACPVP